MLGRMTPALFSPSAKSAQPILRWAGLLLLIGACDDDDGGSGYQQTCARTCARAHDCVSSVNAEQCTRDCNAAFADVGDNLRRDFVMGIDSCLTKLSCDELVIAIGNQMCRDESSARLAPSQAAVALCDAVSASFQECLGLSVGTAGCLDSVKIFDDKALRSALMCVQQPCTERASCLEDQLGISFTGN